MRSLGLTPEEMRERKRLQRKADYQKHREQRLVYGKDYYRKNKTLWDLRQTARAGTPEYRVMKKEAHTRYYQKNREREIAKRIEGDNTRRMTLFNILGGPRCTKCGYSDIRALVFDHIHGGGVQSRLKFGHSRAEISYFLRHPDEAKLTFQVLCQNCNLIKKIENKEFNFKNKKREGEGSTAAFL